MTDPWRIIFMGTPEFAVPALQALLDHHENVVAVVTQPDRPKGRGRKLSPPPVKELALSAGIPVLQPVKVKTELVKQLQPFKPDLIIVAAYGRILPANVLELPRLGCLNIHGSLLPKYRGAAPIQWAILNGEAETGITIMQMDPGLDTGDILLPGKLPITPHDTAASLFPKMAELGGRLLIEALARLRAGNLPPQKQNDQLATLAPPLRKEDAVLDWRNSAFKLSCRIRGLDPWPLAHTTLNGKRLRLFLPEVIEQENDAVPGTILKTDKKGLLIACSQNALLIKEVQLDGSKRMPVASFVLGHHITPGQILGE